MANPERILLNDLQKAVYTALSGNVGATVVDYAADTDFPVVLIGPYTQTGLGSKDQSPSEAMMQIDVFSESSGFKELNTIMDAVIVALTTTELSLAGTSVAISTGLEVAETLIDPPIDGRVIRHGMMQFRWFLVDNVK